MYIQSDTNDNQYKEKLPGNWLDLSGRIGWVPLPLSVMYIPAIFSWICSRKSVDLPFFNDWIAEKSGRDSPDFMDQGDGKGRKVKWGISFFHSLLPIPHIVASNQMEKPQRNWLQYSRYVCNRTLFTLTYLDIQYIRYRVIISKSTQWWLNDENEQMVKFLYPNILPV